MVNAQNQAVGATLLPASENTRCERNTQSYWRAITGIQAHKACLLLRSEFPTGSNKKQIFVFNKKQIFVLFFGFNTTCFQLQSSIPSANIFLR